MTSPADNDPERRLTAAERIDRSRARAWVLQIHYRWESGDREGSLRDALVETTATRRVSPRRLPYIRELLTILDEHLPRIDAVLAAALSNWSLDRLSRIDRAILRIGAAELLEREDVPPKVAIQEAIHLAEAYGGDESPRFVNGVLDALYKGSARYAGSEGGQESDHGRDSSRPPGSAGSRDSARRG